MKNEMKNTRALAEYLALNLNKEEIIPEIMRLFNLDCLQRCFLNPSQLDALIRSFCEGEESDPAALAGIIDFIKAGQAETQNRENELIRTIKAYIDRSFLQDVTIEKMAEEMHISYYYMCHLFKDKCGMPVNTYRTHKRLEKAMRLLSETDLKIADVSSACGFNGISYFTETFTRMVGVSPTAFRGNARGKFFHPFYEYEDMLLTSALDSVRFLPDSVRAMQLHPETVAVYEPDDHFRFLHETAIIAYHGVLYASWYLCPQHELSGFTPIAGKRSFDGGKTWSSLEILCADPTEKILYCPPVYGICDDRLYMLVNQMVSGDHMHSLDLYVLNNETDQFERLWSRPIPFKLNTNVIALPNGKLLLPGRVAEMDGFPNTPAVLISDSGKIDAEWRLVRIAENGNLPDGTELVHPELTAIFSGDTLYMFSRNDQRKVPLVYLSKDMGETWSAACAHDIPYVSSKIYCGTLSDGRHYMVCNTDKFSRAQLTIYFTSDSSPVFTDRFILYDTDEPFWGAMHYPAACESDGFLYIIATKGHPDRSRGAQLFRIDLNETLR